MQVATPRKTKTIAEIGLVLPLSVILYFCGMLFPGGGVYLRYLIPGLMSILAFRHGYLDLALFSIALAVIILMFFGLNEFLITTFMLIPAGFVLPMLYQGVNLFKRILAGVIFIFAAFLLVVFVSQAMGLGSLGLIDSFATWHYALYSKIYMRLGVAEADFLGTIKSLVWLIIPAGGIAYGYMLYLLNKIVYTRGLKLLDRSN